jgi:hypothetical protein
MPSRADIINSSLVWAKRHYGNPPIRMVNLPYFVTFVNSLVEVLDEFGNEAYKKVSHINSRNVGMTENPPKATLLFSEGSPNFFLFSLTHNGYYSLKRNPHTNLWKNFPIDPNIMDVFITIGNNKYPQPITTIPITEPYDLFLTQISSHEDKISIVKAMQFAKENKRLTFIKDHPGAKFDFNELWKEWDIAGMVNDYTRLITDVNVDFLIDNSEFVYCVDSAAIFNAMVKGKRCATFKNMMYSELVPIIHKPRDILNVDHVPEEDVKRFLSWYYHRIAIDVRDPTHKDKIRRIVKDFLDGKNFEETFS